MPKAWPSFRKSYCNASVNCCSPAPTSWSYYYVAPSHQKLTAINCSLQTAPHRIGIVLFGYWRMFMIPHKFEMITTNRSDDLFLEHFKRHKFLNQTELIDQIQSQMDNFAHGDPRRKYDFVKEYLLRHNLDVRDNFFRDKRGRNLVIRIKSHFNQSTEFSVVTFRMRTFVLPSFPCLLSLQHALYTADACTWAHTHTPTDGTNTLPRAFDGLEPAFNASVRNCYLPAFTYS